MTLQNGKIVETSNQFAIGDKAAYDARMAREATAKK
jgi:hypothetical protein